MTNGRVLTEMNSESKEHLSSLMDGEVSKETGRFLVRRLGTDASLRDTWTRYHLIRDCLRHQEGEMAQPDLSARVRSALGREQAPPARSSWASSWFKPVAGAAIAASVALFAVLTVSNINQPAALPTSDVGVATAAAESFTSPNISSLSPRSQPVNLSGQEAGPDQRMNSYLLRHYQMTGEAGGRGFVSFVPIVVTQAEAEQDTAADVTPAAQTAKGSESAQ